MNFVVVNGYPWPEDLLKAFKQKYEQALKDGEPLFKFQGQDIYVKYASLLIEYAEKELGKTL